MATWIDRQFPSAVGHYRQTSGPDGEYNCIAFAAGSTDEWWSHAPGYKWPASRSPTVESLEGVFEALGYRRCTDVAVDPDHDRVVLYAKKGLWTHAARQLPSGAWTSKLGMDEDIEHDTPECLCGPDYGTVHCIMQRSRLQ